MRVSLEQGVLLERQHHAQQQSASEGQPMSAKQDLRTKRRERLRFQLRQKSHGRPRLSVFRSGNTLCKSSTTRRGGHWLRRPRSTRVCGQT